MEAEGKISVTLSRKCRIRLWDESAGERRARIRHHATEDNASWSRDVQNNNNMSRIAGVGEAIASEWGLNPNLSGKLGVCLYALLWNIRHGYSDF